MKQYRVGLIGCGAISGTYLRHAKADYADYFAITALGDLDASRAEAKAAEFGIGKFGTPEVVYNDPDIDLIINLTVPVAHEEVTIKALECGKHVYTEKPLACSKEGMLRIMEVAKRVGKRVGCAPDTFLSAPAQAAKKAIADGWIGDIVGANAICAMRGNEFWRPDADFFYQKGAGPMMDMAPYYLHLLISLMGSVKSVSATSKITWPERTIKVAPRRGEKIKVEVPTFVSSAMRFENDAIVTFVNSFDIWKTQQPFVEIYGEQGTMVIPDPNRFDGDVLIRRLGEKEWQKAPTFTEYSKYGRGIGVADMVRSIEAGVPHKASFEMAYHATDVILTMDAAGEAHRELEVASAAPQPGGLWETPETILWK